MAKLGNTDLDVFGLCLGGNVFGWSADEDESFAILDAYAAAGGNFIDTADVYSLWVPGNCGGDSERIIGRWLKARGNRDAMVIATKVAKLPSRPGLSADVRRGQSRPTRQLGHLRRDHHRVPVAARLQPATDDPLGIATAVPRHPQRIHVGGVDEVAAGRRVRVQDRERLVLVRRPAEDVAAEAQPEDVQICVPKFRHGSNLAAPP